MTIQTLDLKCESADCKCNIIILCFQLYICTMYMLHTDGSNILYGIGNAAD